MLCSASSRASAVSNEERPNKLVRSPDPLLVLNKLLPVASRAPRQPPCGTECAPGGVLISIFPPGDCPPPKPFPVVPLVGFPAEPIPGTAEAGSLIDGVAERIIFTGDNPSTVGAVKAEPHRPPACGDAEPARKLGAPLRCGLTNLGGGANLRGAEIV